MTPFKYSQKLCHELKFALDQVGDEQKNAFNLMGGNEIRAWMKQLDDLKNTNDQLEILVGVAGATGAGKTSLLNALLETPELLPSSSQEAATATVCRIAYNTDETSGNEFKAEVVFRSKEDVIKELDDVLRAIQERKDLYKQEFEDEQERIEAINEMTEIIARSISHVCAVWDLDEGDLEEEEYTAVSIIERHPDILMALGTTKIIRSSDCGDFAIQVKPYLDSTQTPEGMTAWPLIKEVRLFVKSDILKRGIVLVDLPGLSDASEGRSQVAEEYFQKLTLTTIVSPAIRAADEKTAVNLMNNYQETRMKLDGRYHKESFCVVISKIDDIDCDAFCSASREALKD
ncbi:Dynamin family-domain-containing protein [Cladorrhinum samala]|uniref:Dynamin family-domain-containing protein n=1 Tax=Cladorrhinum samala TaxID=585594 RepID=A0AAV9HLC4_9PEZI|nr:Dynamin family-domain-containing protein [Cladorrhinum samala]